MAITSEQVLAVLPTDLRDQIADGSEGAAFIQTVAEIAHGPDTPSVLMAVRSVAAQKEAHYREQAEADGEQFLASCADLERRGELTEELAAARREVEAENEARGLLAGGEAS